MSEAHVEAIMLKPEQRLNQCITHQRIAVSYASQFAMDLMKLAMIQPAVPDGEDSNGTRQYRMMTEAEVVGRAMAIADLAFEAFKSKGWIADAPTMADLMNAEGRPMGLLRRVGE